MRFKFNIHVTEKDYLDYNRFWQFQSPYGKKQIISLRVIFALLFGIAAIATLIGGDFTIDSIIEAAIFMVAMAIFQFILPTILAWSLKRQIKVLKKKGKMAYAPEATMDFYEEIFTSKTPESKTETKYTTIERISVVRDKAIYLHVNNVMAYIIPIKSFASNEQFESFLTFIQSKCTNLK